MAKAVQYLHSKNVIHRDLKPGAADVCQKKPAGVWFWVTWGRLVGGSSGISLAPTQEQTIGGLDVV